MSSHTATADVRARAPQRQRGRDRVAGLLAAAGALFLEKGVEATTMTEIAARAGAAIGSLYLFFPTKGALVQAMATELADALSAELDALRDSTAGADAAQIVDALFGQLAKFLQRHPVYAVLVELPGEESWKAAVRVHRRAQIEALLTQARPALPPGQSARLALILPHLLALPLRLGGVSAAGRDEVVDEMRRMLRSHLGQFGPAAPVAP